MPGRIPLVEFDLVRRDHDARADRDMMPAERFVGTIIGDDGDQFAVGSGLDLSLLMASRVPVRRSLSESEARTMLERLAARHLTEGEIVGGSLRKGAAGYRHDFEVARSQGGVFCLMTNGSPAHYTATIEEVGDGPRT